MAERCRSLLERLSIYSYRVVVALEKAKHSSESGADSRQSSLPGVGGEGWGWRDSGMDGKGRGKESMIIEIRVATVTRC